jgi:hypothetical protein
MTLQVYDVRDRFEGEIVEFKWVISITWLLTTNELNNIYIYIENVTRTKCLKILDENLKLSRKNMWFSLLNRIGDIHISNV